VVKKPVNSLLKYLKLNINMPICLRSKMNKDMEQYFRGG
jgi:hypothetical protein